MRYFLEIMYKGTAYHGWQVQPNARTVQGEILQALNTILPREEMKTLGSGRTDTGVHASQQFMQVDLQHPLSERKHMYKLNAILPRDISIRRILPVTEEANARYDAFRRSYEYHITRIKDPFRQNQAYFYTKELDIERMNRAAELMLEWTDFECFSKTQTDVKTFNCDIDRAEWKEDNEHLVFYVSANRFLRGMVRAITGTLLLVGRGKKSIEDFQQILESRDRTQAGRSVPAEGLFLSRVEYPEHIFLKD